MLSWYSLHLTTDTSNDVIHHEAGSSLATILFAISLVLGGSSLAEAASRASKESKAPVSQNDVARAMKNPKFVNYVKTKGTPEKSQKYKLDSIVRAIISHEGLLPRQTPFRITSPAMRNWGKIYGLEIDKRPQGVPASRRNFIFMKRQQDVPLAVQKLLEKYSTTPSKYGLPDNVTLLQALKKFDQTGAKGKIEFLKKQMPGININAPLKSFM